MTHDQLVDLAKEAVENVLEDKTVDDEQRVISLTELQDDINSYLYSLTGDEDDDDA